MKLKIFGLNKVVDKKIEQFRAVLEDDDLKQRMGRTAVTHVRKRTSDGLDFNENAFKPLAGSTISKRSYLEKFNRTSNHYIDVFSNLHFTGQLVKALAFIIENGRVFIFVKDSARKPYKTKGGNGSAAPTNKQVAKYQSDMGRVFLGVDNKLRQKIRELAVRAIKRFTRRR